MERTVAAIAHDGRVALVREPAPEPGEGEVLVRVRVSLFSPGTEMTLVRARRATPEPEGPPTRFGYSNAGDVVAVGPGVTELVPGMRVAGMGGGALHATHACVPVNLAVPLPEGVSYEEGAYLSLAATALQAVRRTRPCLGEYGVVLGLGLVGQFAAQLYRLSGARVAGLDTFPLRRERAHGLDEAWDARDPDATARLRAFAAPYGLDFACFAFGGPADAAYAGVKPAMKVSADGHEMGRVVLVGGCSLTLVGGATNGNLDFLVSSRTGPGYHDDAWEHGRDYPRVFVPFTARRNAGELARLLAEKRLSASSLTTHRLPFAEAGRAVDLLLDDPGRTLGVVLEMP